MGPHGLGPNGTFEGKADLTKQVKRKFHKQPISGAPCDISWLLLLHIRNKHHVGTDNIIQVACVPRLIRQDSRVWQGRAAGKAAEKAGQQGTEQQKGSNHNKYLHF